jgi:Tol biopolymer transport system component
MNKQLLTRLDLVAWTVVALVVVGVLAINNLSDPARRGATVAYIYPAYSGISNVWFASVNDPTQKEQVTFTEYGIYDFAVSADGTYVAYSERTEPTGLHEIMLLNLNNKQITQVTNCVAEEADCRAPAFRPTGNAIAYERLNTNTGIGTGIGVTRIWLADLSTTPYDNQPLSQDSNFVGYQPQWAADGNSLAFYSSDLANPGILVYNFNPSEGDQTLKFVPSQNGVVGALSPNGSQLVFPEYSRRTDGNAAPFLRLADLEGLSFIDLTNPEDNIDDIDAVWYPDGKRLVILRRYLDERFTRGYQLFTLDLADKSVTPLLVDQNFSHGYFSFDSSGTMITMQRFGFDPNNAAGTTPGVWTLNLATNAMTLLSDNAFSPRWVIGAPSE